MLPLLVPGDQVPVSPNFRWLEQPRRFWAESYAASKLTYFGDIAANGYTQQTGQTQAIAGSIYTGANGVPGVGGYLIFGRDTHGRPVLPRHPREPDDRYVERLAQAMVRPYVRHIVDRYVDHVCRDEPVRDLDGDDVSDAYQDFVADPTGRGISIQSVIRKVVVDAVVLGTGWGLVDNAAEGVFGSAAAEAAAGSRAILRHLRPDQVVWWQEWDGHIVAGIVLMRAKDGKPFLWAVDETHAQWISLKAEPGTPMNSWSIAEAHAPVPHSYGGCPLVRMVLGLESAPMAAPWADSQRRIAVVDSWLLQEIGNNTFTTQVFLGISPEQIRDQVIGAGMALCLPPGPGSTSNPAVAKIGSDPAQAQSLRDQLALEVRELYRAAGLSSGSPTEVAAPESGIAKAFAFNEVESRLSMLAEACELFERRVTELAARGFGWPTVPEPARWPREFAPMDLAAAIEACVSLDTSGAPAVAKRLAWSDLIQRQFRPTGDDASLLEEQLEAIGDPAERPTDLTNPAGRMAGT